MGDWILLAALQRIEAGTLHALSGRPKHIKICDYPWHIAIVQAPECNVSVEAESLKEEIISQTEISKIRNSLIFQYPHSAATRISSKQTATDRKGRIKDQEAAENAPEPPVMLRKWRRPAFAAPEISGKEFGNVMHLVMQHVVFDQCTSIVGLQGEIKRMVESGFLKPEQANAVNPVKLLNFFSTDIGKKLCSGIPYLREFKFSILDSGLHYDPSLVDDRVLLQGVVDCALLEPDGITVIDFKTDYVTEETIPSVVSRYISQIQTYADALQRIYEQPVKARYLYLFHLDKLVAV